MRQRESSDYGEPVGRQEMLAMAYLTQIAGVAWIALLMLAGRAFN